MQDARRSIISGVALFVEHDTKDTYLIEHNSSLNSLRVVMSLHSTPYMSNA